MKGFASTEGIDWGKLIGGTIAYGALIPGLIGRNAEELK